MSTLEEDICVRFKSEQSVINLLNHTATIFSRRLYLPPKTEMNRTALQHRTLAALL